MSIPRKIKHSIVLAAGLALALTGRATSLYITNADFEIPVLGDGSQNGPTNDVPGWTEYEPSNPQDWNISNPDAVTMPNGAHGGQNVLSLLAYDPAVAYLEQQLTNTVQSNTSYTLSVWAANPDNGATLSYNSLQIMLYAGSTLLGTTNIQPVTAGEWIQGSVTIDTGNIPPLANQPLKIRLMWGNSQGSYRLFVDDVQLDATPLTPSAPLYSWDGTANNWNTPHWNPGLIAWPGSGNDAQVTNGLVNIPDASGAFQAGNMGVIGGAVSVTGASGYSGVGNTVIANGGTLTLNGVASPIQSLTLVGGTLAATNPDALLGSWQLQSSVVVNAGGTATISAPQVVLGDSARSFDISSGASLNLSGTLRTSNGGNNEGLVKNGTGTLTLGGSNSYDGQTIVNAGTLIVGNVSGSATGSGDVTVASGGTLAGSGTIAGNVSIQSGGTVSPGAPLGALTVNGSLTLAGNILMDVNKTGSVITNDSVKGMSSVTYGGTLYLNNLGAALALGDTIHLFNATSYGGSFGAISPSSPGPGLVWDTTGLLTQGTISVGADIVVGALYINNPGFENPVLASGAEDSAAGYQVPGWIDFEPSHPWEWDVFYPNAATLPAGAHGGQNVLNTIAYDPLVQYVEQQLTNTLQLNTRYTFSAWVVDPDNKGGFINSVSILIYAGSTFLSAATIQPTANGIWTAGSCVYDSGNGEAAAGQPLKIRIAWGNNASYRMFIDDVSLTAVPITNVNPYYVWDGSVNNWSTAHWNAGSGLVSWPGASYDALVTGGTVNIPDSSAFSANSVELSNGVVNVTALDGYLGVVNTLVSSGGTLNLNGASSFLGQLTLAGGTLSAASPVSAGSWQLSTIVNAVGGVISTISAPQVALGDPGRALQVSDGSTLNVTGTFRNSFAGDGIVKIGNGNLILVGANTYDGTTTVSAGTLTVNNIAGSGAGSGDVTVNAGATLAGVGRIAGNVTVQTNGTLAPGPGIGTLTIGGSLSLQGGTVMEISKTGNSITNDLVKGMSTVTYGGTLTINNLGGAWAVGDQIKLFNAASYTGSFSAVPGGPGPGLSWDISGLTNNGTVTVALGPEPASIAPGPDKRMQIGISGIPGQSYTVLRSANLTTPLSNWTVVARGTITNAPFIVIDPSSTNANAPRRFYIIRYAP